MSGYNLQNRLSISEGGPSGVSLDPSEQMQIQSSYGNAAMQDAIANGTVDELSALAHPDSNCAALAEMPPTQTGGGAVITGRF